MTTAASPPAVHPSPSIGADTRSAGRDRHGQDVIAAGILMRYRRAVHGASPSHTEYDTAATHQAIRRLFPDVTLVEVFREVTRVEQGTRRAA